LHHILCTLLEIPRMLKILCRHVQYSTVYSEFVFQVVSNWTVALAQFIQQILVQYFLTVFSGKEFMRLAVALKTSF
jgi:hypothetical protein